MTCECGREWDENGACKDILRYPERGNLGSVSEHGSSERGSEETNEEVQSTILHQGERCMIIGIAGMAGAGKDTIGDMLVENHGFTKLFFAQNLKEMCKNVFNLSDYDVYDMEGKEKPFASWVTFSEAHADGILKWIYEKNGYKITREIEDKISKVVAKNITWSTPRELLQYVGTEICRQCVDQNFHIDVLKREMDMIRTDRHPYKAHFVVTDARFPNERYHIRKWGGVNWLVEEVLEQVKEGNIGISGHESETSLGGPNDYETVIFNDKKHGLDVLAQKIGVLVTQLEK